jgi:enoyl-CoA hydratase
MSAAAPLRIERSGGVVTLTLDRPEKMNALSAPLVDALLEQVEGAYGDGTRLLVLRGNGRNFSAGFDMGGYEKQSEGDLLLRFVRIEQLLQAVRHAPFDTLALAHGKNFGAGVDLIAACARRVASPEATFRMPGLKFGLVLGTRLFAQRVGAQRARQVLQVSQTFNAVDGLAWGFMTELAPQQQWPAAVQAAQEAAAALSPEAAASLYRVTADDHRDADLAELVRSAAAPGLKMRIAEYLAPVTPGAAQAATARGSISKDKS